MAVAGALQTAAQEQSAAVVDVGGDDYPRLFRQMLACSVAAALAAFDPAAPQLTADDRERSLHILSLALDLDEAWAPTRDLTLTIAPLMETQGYRHEWIDYLERGLAQAEKQADHKAQARFHLLLARLFQLMDDAAAGDHHLAVSRTLAEQTGAQDVLVGVLDRQAAAAANRAEFSQARALAEQVLAGLGPDDPAGATAHHILGLLALRQARWDDAIAEYTRVYALRQQQQVPRFLAQALRDLAFAHRHAGNYALAVAYYQRALAMLAASGDTYEYAMAQNDLGIVYWYTGDYATALANFKAVEPIFARAGSLLSLARVYNNIGLVYRELGQVDSAREAFANSLSLAQQLDHHYEVANVLDSLAGMQRQQGDLDAAIATWDAALLSLERLPERPQHLYGLIVSRRQAAQEEAAQLTHAAPR
jgi:tetratricopeptide (TPR) repeat protein